MRDGEREGYCGIRLDTDLGVAERGRAGVGAVEVVGNAGERDELAEASQCGTEVAISTGVATSSPKLLRLQREA